MRIVFGLLCFVPAMVWLIQGMQVTLELNRLHDRPRLEYILNIMGEWVLVVGGTIAGCYLLGF